MNFSYLKNFNCTVFMAHFLPVHFLFPKYCAVTQNIVNACLKEQQKNSKRISERKMSECATRGAVSSCKFFRSNSLKTQHTCKRIFCNNNSSFEIYPTGHGTENLHTAEINTG